VAASWQGGARADWSGAVRELEAAVAAYDLLPYIEPEHWYLPLRHCLAGAYTRPLLSST